jgi:hypothetical protein
VSGSSPPGCETIKSYSTVTCRQRDNVIILGLDAFHSASAAALDSAIHGMRT